MAFEEKLGEAYVELTTRGSVQPQLEREKTAAREAAAEFRRTSAAAQGVGPGPAGTHAAFKQSAFDSIMRTAARMQETGAKRFAKATDEATQSLGLLSRVGGSAGVAATALVGVAVVAKKAWDTYKDLVDRSVSNVQISNPMLAFQHAQTGRDVAGVLGQVEQPLVQAQMRRQRLMADLIAENRDMLRSLGVVGAGIAEVAAASARYIPESVLRVMTLGGLPRNPTNRSLGAGLNPFLGGMTTSEGSWAELAHMAAQIPIDRKTGTGDGGTQTVEVGENSIQRFAAAILGGATGMGWAMSGLARQG